MRSVPLPFARGSRPTTMTGASAAARAIFAQRERPPEPTVPSGAPRGAPLDGRGALATGRARRIARGADLTDRGGRRHAARSRRPTTARPPRSGGGCARSSRTARRAGMDLLGARPPPVPSRGPGSSYMLAAADRWGDRAMGGPTCRGPSRSPKRTPETAGCASTSWPRTLARAPGGSRRFAPGDELWVTGPLGRPVLPAARPRPEDRRRDPGRRWRRRGAAFDPASPACRSAASRFEP